MASFDTPCEYSHCGNNGNRGEAYLLGMAANHADQRGFQRDNSKYLHGVFKSQLFVFKLTHSKPQPSAKDEVGLKPATSKSMVTKVVVEQSCRNFLNLEGGYTRWGCYRMDNTLADIK